MISAISREVGSRGGEHEVELDELRRPGRLDVDAGHQLVAVDDRWGVGLLVALNGKVDQAAPVPDALEEGSYQPHEGPPGLRVVGLEDDEARGLGDGPLYVEHQSPHVYAVQGRGLTQERLLTPDGDAGVGERDDGIDALRIEIVALIAAGPVANVQGAGYAAPVDARRGVPDAGLLIAPGEAPCHGAGWRNALSLAARQVLYLDPRVVEGAVGRVERRVGVHPLALAKVDRLLGFEMERRLG